MRFGSRSSRLRHRDALTEEACEKAVQRLDREETISMFKMVVKKSGVLSS